MMMPACWDAIWVNFGDPDTMSPAAQMWVWFVRRRVSVIMPFPSCLMLALSRLRDCRLGVRPVAMSK